MNGCNIVDSMSVISLNNLIIGYTHNRQPIPVMGKINASLERGELVALIGENGAGKSTLLRTISAFQEPLEGTITYPDGCNKLRKASELSTQLAVVFPNNSNIRGMRVRETVSLGRMPYTNALGRMRNTDKEAINHAMDLIGITHLEERYIETLSDGERQKTMIAKALAQETPVIVLDEPTAFLDFGSRVQLLRMLKELAHKNNKAILVSTHDLELALQIADRLWLIHNKQMYTGNTTELTNCGILQTFIEDEGIRYNTAYNRIELI